MTRRDLAELVLLGAIWGASFYFMRVAVPSFGPIPLATTRVLLAGLTMLPVMLLQADVRQLRGRGTQITVLAIVNSALPFCCFSFAASRLPAGVSALLNATVPIWSALIARVWLGERLPRSGLAGVTVGFLGVALLVASRYGLQGAASVPAMCACLLATLSYGVSANYSRRYLRDLPATALTSASKLTAFLLLVPLAATQAPASVPPWPAIRAVVLLAVLGTALASLLYFRLLARVGTARTVAVTYLVPLFGMFWAWLLLPDERITTAMLASGAIILLGVSLTTGVLPRWWLSRRRPVVA